MRLNVRLLYLVHRNVVCRRGRVRYSADLFGVADHKQVLDFAFQLLGKFVDGTRSERKHDGVCVHSALRLCLHVFHKRAFFVYGNELCGQQELRPRLFEFGHCVVEVLEPGAGSNGVSHFDKGQLVAAFRKQFARFEPRHTRAYERDFFAFEFYGTVEYLGGGEYIRAVRALYGFGTHGNSARRDYDRAGIERRNVPDRGFRAETDVRAVKPSVGFEVLRTPAYLFFLGSFVGEIYLPAALVFFLEHHGFETASAEYLRRRPWAGWQISFLRREWD